MHKRIILSKSWRTIGLEIPGRSEDGCQNRHKRLIKEHAADSMNVPAAITKNALAADTKNDDDDVINATKTKKRKRAEDKSQQEKIRRIIAEGIKKKIKKKIER